MLLILTSGRPMPLSQMCKINIRKSLGPSKVDNISELNIPSVVKESLMKNNYLRSSEVAKVDLSREKCDLAEDDRSDKEKFDIPEDVKEAVRNFSLRNDCDRDNSSDDELQTDVLDDKSGNVKV